jgi:hypothetical protein
MSDTILAGLDSFYERYDRRVRRLMAGALCVSLLLSTAIAASAVGSQGADPKLASVLWRFGVIFPPSFTALWWIFTELMARGRRKATRPDWRLPETADDARNGMRIANAGFVFTLGLTATIVANQALMALPAFGHPLGQPLATLAGRVIMVIVGAVTMYLGNVWPRMPALRAPDQRPHTQMKANRLIGWFMVLLGASFVLLGLFLPTLQGPRL